MSEEDDLSTAALNQEETLDLGSDQEATPAVVEDFDLERDASEDSSQRDHRSRLRKTFARK